MTPLRPSKNLVVVAALTLVYVIAGKLGLMLAFVHASATAVWPPTAIALVAFLLLGHRVWPAILLGAFPIWRHLHRELAKDHTLVRYDARGNGLSDRTVDEISFDAFLSDLETVVDAAGLTRFALLGISQGCAVSIAYAVRHPERLSHLILYGGYALGSRKRARTAAEEEVDAAYLTLMRVGWGQENAAFRQLFTSQFIPGATKEQSDWFNELQRITASPEVAARMREVNGQIDVTALLPRVTVPTLVLHARDDARVPFESGRRMAAGIPRARFVSLQGRNHLFLETEPAFGQFLEHTRTFLAT